MELCTNCGKPYVMGDWPICPHGTPGPFFRGDAAIHTSERAVVYENPVTGHTHMPGRVDRPMHPKLQAAGYVRKELDVPGIRKLEKTKGLVHEASNYDQGSARPERDTGSR